MNDQPSLLESQWKNYETAHHDAKNLVIHAVTVPVFMAGTVTVAIAPFAAPALAAAGLAAMVAAMAAQGRGHRMEAEAPAPFRGPLDVIARIFAEQWITFPRFVLTGGFRRAFRGR
jgi:hypothetical protein